MVNFFLLFKCFYDAYFKPSHYIYFVYLDSFSFVSTIVYFKETIGQATAGRHPRQTSTIENYPQTGIVHRRIAGQSGAVTISPNIQTVKVVD